jgi:uncharacterized Zn finger protein
MDVSVEIHCDRCGSANYSLPAGAGDEAVVRCNDCGVHLGTMAALKAELVRQVADHSAEQLRRGLDRLRDGDAGEAA